jgi:hypothetical protein
MKKVGIAALVTLCVLGIAAFAARGLITEKLTLKRGADAYLVGYPLVTMAATRESMLATPGAAPNTFSHARFLPDGSTGVGVVAPNRDTYYSSAWLDLSDGPLLIEQPDMGDTFWLMPVLDMWTEVFADPGTRTLGNAAHQLVIAGPGWQGEVPAGARLYRSPTPWAWAILRLEAGPDVARLQDGFTIAPLDDPEAIGDAAVFTAPAGGRDVKAQVDALSGEEFFSRVAQELPSAPAEPEAAAVLERVGVTPGSFTAPEGRAAAGLADVPARVQAGMSEALSGGEGATEVNGWRVPPMILGDYGTEFPTRAVVAREGLGANLPADAVYASTTVDVTGEPLAGGRTYTLDMPADVPVEAFWSVSLYDDRGNFLPGKGGWSVSGTGGQEAVRITVSPQKVDGLWLRAPDQGPFRLLMRLYWPRPSVLANEWPYPPVTPAP